MLSAVILHWGWRMTRFNTGLAGVAIEVVTFATARPRDATFAASFSASGIACVRYESHYDIVPKLPLGGPPDAALRAVLSSFGIAVPTRDLGFVPLGIAVAESATEADGLPGPATAFPFNLAAHLAGAPLGDAYRAIAAHAITPGSHYDHLLSNHGVA